MIAPLTTPRRCTLCQRVPVPPNRMSRGSCSYCIECKRQYSRDLRAKHRAVEPELKLEQKHREKIPNDPVMYLLHCVRLQVVVDRIDVEEHWSKRIVIPTRPGYEPLFAEVESMSTRQVCRHCGDVIASFACYVCAEGGADVSDQCPACHGEVAHGLIRNQNIHICSSGTSPVDPDSNGGWSNVVKEMDR